MRSPDFSTLVFVRFCDTRIATPAQSSKVVFSVIGWMGIRSMTPFLGCPP